MTSRIARAGLKNLLTQRSRLRLSTATALALLGIAFGGSGCEIGLLVAAVTDEPPPDPYENYTETVWCNEATGSGMGFAGLSSANGNAQLFGMGIDAPFPRLAASEQLDFFIEVPDLEWGPSTTFGVEGDLTRLDDSQGACASWNAEAASFVEVETGTGAGSIVVYDDGSEYTRFPFEVSEATQLTVSFDPNASVATALLLDEEGRPLYAQAGLTWQIVPSGNSFTGPLKGLQANLFPDGINNEVIVTVFFQDLSASMTLENAGGIFQQVD